MNTTKALANGQKQLLGVVRGMMGTMRLAAMAAEGMQRAMEAADRKAAERTQRSLEAAERAVGGLIVPLDDAARGLKALAGAMDAAGKRAAGFMQAGATVRIATTIPLPAAGGAAAGPAEEAAALSERAQLEEKIKKEVIPAFGKLVEMVASATPRFKTLEVGKSGKEDGKKDGSGNSKSDEASKTEALLGRQVQLQEEAFGKIDPFVFVHLQALGRINDSVGGLSQIAQTGIDQATGVLRGILDKVSGMASALAQSSSVMAGAEAAGAAPFDLSKGSSDHLPVLYTGPPDVEVLAEKAASNMQTADAAAKALNGSERPLALEGPAEEEEEGPKYIPDPELPKLNDAVTMLRDNLVGLMSQSELVTNVIADNWSVFGPIYDGVNQAVSLYNTLQMASKAVTAATTIGMHLHAAATIGVKNAWAGMNATMKANVIITIISLIVGLIAAIIALWKNNDSFAFFFVKAWYSILEFFYRIPVYFWTVAEAIMQVLVLLANKVGEIFDNIFNGLIEKFNKALDVFNKIAGTDIQFDFELNTKDLANAALEFIQDKKADALENAEKKAADFAEKEQKFIEDRKAQREAEEEAKKLANAESLLQGSGLDSPGPAIRQDAVVSVGGGRIDEVGSVNDTVDISSEDLKTMRELAEMKNIQNFVTLQPSVNVQTGDIRNGMDVSSMVQAITSVLQEEIASSAQGVYE